MTRARDDDDDGDDDDDDARRTMAGLDISTSRDS